MRNFSSDRFIPTDVLIRFEDGSELVTVPRGATLDYISETLNRLSLWHCGKALSVDLHFQASDECGHRHAPSFSRHRSVATSPRPVSPPRNKLN